MNPQMKQIMGELNKANKELSLATEAEEKSRKAMDELASVLQQVAAEASQAKQKQRATEAENEQIRLTLKSTVERLVGVMAERNEFKNAAERLRLEADETLANWHVKESGLVGCMRKLEEERSRAQAENLVLKEEMNKLRDILKQAMIEAISAKEDASLARGENLKLEDQLAEKDTALNFISRELESSRASEAAVGRSLNDLNLRLVESGIDLTMLDSKTHYVENQQEIKPEKVQKKKAFNFGLGCSGRNKWLVDEKAVVRGGSSLGLGTMPCRFPEEARMPIEDGNDSLRNKALSKRFVRLLSRSSSKSRVQ